MDKKKTILFLHGFYASGSCILAQMLKASFRGRAQVMTPDLPIRPREALKLIRNLCDTQLPDVIVGNSCGSFYAQMIASTVGVPALLGNPHFKMTEFLKNRIGEHEYKSPRADGNQRLVIDEPLVSEFAEMQAVQFVSCNPISAQQVWGLFGEHDTLAHYEPLFLQYYSHSYHFPGGHTPTADEVVQWYVPLIEQLLDKYPH